MKSSAPYKTGQRLPLKPGTPGSEADQRLVLRLSVNPRARRISIRIDNKLGEAVAVAPSERRLADAVAFARSKAAWIAERLEARAEGRPLEPGQVIPVHGIPTRLEASGGAGAARLVQRPDGPESGPVIRSGGEGEAFARRVENLLKREARAALIARTDHHLTTLKQKPVRVSIIDARSRWGSCSPHNRSIRYSWRVVLAPPAVLDYLAAHEVAHLVHADHSPAYWSVVHGLVGDHRPFRTWLRAHGQALHAVGR